MAKRRPRCECGDLFSHHDWLEGESPCLGPVCKALRYRDLEDGCLAYTPSDGPYEPLEGALRTIGLDRATLAALLAEDAASYKAGGGRATRGPLGQAADAERQERARAEDEADERQWEEAHGVTATRTWPYGFVVIRYSPTRTDHLVYAAGGPADGSLYGFRTLCQRRIEDPDRWDEQPRTLLGLVAHRCASCERTAR